MIERIPQYIKGYVKIKLISPMPERFLSLCVHNRIPVWNLISRQSAYEFEMELSVRDFFRLNNFRRKTHSKIILLEKHGLPFFFQRNQKRKAFFLGLLLCVGLLLFLSGRLWEIDVEGNVRNSTPEILDFLEIRPGQQGLDCTLGYGGHSRKMLEKLEGEGRLVGLDIDPIESEKTVKRLRAAGFSEDTFQFRLMNFANIDKVAEEFGQFDFVLADLGVSSMQIDDPKRGFSYKTEGPLDLRLDPMHGDSAADRLLQVTQKEFEGMLIENSDEPYAAEIAASVFGRLKNGKKIETTTDLRNAVEAALVRLRKAEREEAVKKSCARTFQALRIDVNSEFEVLYSFLEKLDGILKSGARVAILTFHSGEDRLVKKAFKELKKAGVYAEISADVIRPSAEECRLNPRARSTKMRWAVKAE